MESRGCAKVATDSDPIAINPNWTHAQVNEWLENLFPRLFKYVHEHHGGRHQNSSRNPGQVWALLSKERRILEMVPIATPGGKELLRFKGRDRASTADSHIFIGMFLFGVSCDFIYAHFSALLNAIPADVYKSWDPAYIESDDSSDNSPSDEDCKPICLLLPWTFY